MASRKGAIATIVTKTVPREEVSSYGVVVSDEEGRILSFQEKPAIDEALSTCINTGIYVFEPEIIDFIPPNSKYDIGGELFPELVAKGAPFYALNMDFEWVDMGKSPTIGRQFAGVIPGN
jgi:mannose-1-phosphate guanylyltransferase